MNCIAHECEERAIDAGGLCAKHLEMHIKRCRDIKNKLMEVKKYAQ